ncbi:MAG TPA: matrixin family metalloprotease, partial [Polyangiaceae bacterium]|nr:matrixin family metalloprotease [Polyangiaceae bacterium]
MRSSPIRRRRGRGSLRFGLAAAALGALVFSTSAAHAFCRTETGGLRSNTCSPTATDCCTVGKPLYWKTGCVGFSIQKDASKQIPYDTALSIISNAFEKWHNVNCGSGTVSLDFRSLDAVQCDQVQYNTNPDEGNANIIVFRDTAWAHSDSNNTLGLTTVTFDPDTGEIFDADMEINTAQQTLTVPPATLSSTGFDFESIVTHEAGHFLGLAHSADAQATMYAHYFPGSTTMRTLTSDDTAGVCSIYVPPTNRSATGERTVADGGAVAAGSCDTTPRHGFSGVCGSGGNWSPPKSCSIASIGDATGTSGRTASIVAALGIALALGVRRRARRARPPTPPSPL